MRIFQKQLIIFTVEYRNKRICKTPDQCNHDKFYRHYTGQTPVKKFFYIIKHTFAKAFADQWLYTLCHSVHDRHSHK